MLLDNEQVTEEVKKEIKKNTWRQNESTKFQNPEEMVKEFPIKKLQQQKPAQERGTISNKQLDYTLRNWNKRTNKIQSYYERNHEDQRDKYNRY